MFVSKILFIVDSKLPLFTITFHITPCLIFKISLIPNFSVRDSYLARPCMSSFCRIKKDTVFSFDLISLKYSLLELYNSPVVSIFVNISSMFSSISISQCVCLDNKTSYPFCVRAFWTEDASLSLITVSYTHLTLPTKA